MKNTLKSISVLLLLYIGVSFIPQPVQAQGASVSFQVFYDDLSPYGTWINSPEYGYVWVPNVGSGFTPYATNGYWVYTDMGWTWVSNYTWGWAPFHYGRWYNDAAYGPMWIPGNEWGPGWVTWRQSEGYYGWAPIGPGVSMDIAYSNGYNVPYDRWTFVRSNNFGGTNINNYYVDRSTNVTIINNTTVINNVQGTNAGKYSAGPERFEAEKRAGRTFTPLAVKEISKPGQNVSKDQLQIYRPQVQKNNANGAKPAPVKVASIKDLKTPAQRTEAAPVQKIKTNEPAKVQPKQSSPTQQPVQPQQGKLNQQPDRVRPPQGNLPHNNGGEMQHQPNRMPNNQAPVQRQQPAPTQQPDRERPQQQQPNNTPRNMGGEMQHQQSAPMRQPDRGRPQQQQPNNPPPRNMGGEMQQHNQPPVQHEQPAPMQQPDRGRPQQQQPNNPPPQQNQQHAQPRQNDPPQNTGEKRPH